MKYNPKIHNRRSIRLKGYDYSKAGAYFITICCKHMECRFGKVISSGKSVEMQLNEFGQIAYEEWVNLPERFPHVSLDVFQIMPNHMHGIIVLKESEESFAVSSDGSSTYPGFSQYMDTAEINEQENPKKRGSPVRAGIGDIIGAYKSLVSNFCLEVCKARNERMGKLWHRNYYDNIIWNESSYYRISEYIITNPQKWFEDKFYRK